MPTYPVSRPSVSGTDITVDLYSKQPTLMLRTIQSMVQNDYWLSDLFFNPGGTTQSGAIVYNQVTALDDQFTDRDIEDVGPGDEFPIVDASNISPQAAFTVKRGAKMQITKEMRTRNDIGRFRNKTTAMYNSTKRKSDSKAIAVVTAAVSATTIPTQSQSAAWTTTTTDIMSDVFSAVDLVENSTLGKAEGYKVDTLVLARDMFLAIKKNSTLRTAFYQGMDPVRAAQLLQMNALDGMFGIPRVRMNPFLANGTRWLADTTRVGKNVTEYPLELEFWNDQRTQSDWYQLSESNVFVIEHPKAAVTIA